MRIKKKIIKKCLTKRLANAPRDKALKRQALPPLLVPYCFFVEDTGVKIPKHYRETQHLLPFVRQRLSMHPAIGCVFRGNAGVIRIKDDSGVVRAFHGLEKGFSDIFGFLKNGRAFFLELKSPGKMPTDPQIRFLAHVQHRGALIGLIDHDSLLDRLLTAWLIQ